MQIGFRHLELSWTESHVGWPAIGLRFLEHQFVLDNPEESDYESMADGFTALTCLDPDNDFRWNGSFLAGMIRSLHIEIPSRLRIAVIEFIGHHARQIFSAGVEAMVEEHRRIFFASISSGFHFGHEERPYRKILTFALMSPMSRPYLTIEHLDFLEFLARRALDISMRDAVREGVQNSELIPTLKRENLLDGAILKIWLKVLWMELYDGFVSTEVDDQLRSTTKELFIQRPELVDEFRTAIASLMADGNNEYASTLRKQRRAKLEMVCNAPLASPKQEDVVG
jgi:hypothetical protein